MDCQHKAWNERQKQLRQLLSNAADLTKAIQLFLIQHAMVHSATISSIGTPSFSDVALEGVSDQQVRVIPSGTEHSIAWIFWHMARIEDLTMNVLLANQPQVFSLGKWQDKLVISLRDTGNSMDVDQIELLSRSIQISELQSYRDAVGRQTRVIVQRLRYEDIKDKVDPSRLQRCLDEGAVTDDAHSLLDYWGRLTYIGLLLMPPTRHNLVHLNEVLRVRKKLKIKNE